MSTFVSLNLFYMKKKFLLGVGAMLALGTGITTAYFQAQRPMTERERLMRDNIEAMGWSIESFARSFADCYQFENANCCVIERSGDGIVVSTDHPEFIAKN